MPAAGKRASEKKKSTCPPGEAKLIELFWGERVRRAGEVPAQVTGTPRYLRWTTCAGGRAYNQLGREELST